MSEDEFIDGLKAYYDDARPYDEVWKLWRDFICKPENEDLFEFCVRGKQYRPTIEEVRKQWQIESSPLNKALK